jgi:hypothetical protein
LEQTQAKVRRVGSQSLDSVSEEWAEVWRQILFLVSMEVGERWEKDICTVDIVSFGSSTSIAED